MLCYNRKEKSFKWNHFFLILNLKCKERTFLQSELNFYVNMGHNSECKSKFHNSWINWFVFCANKTYDDNVNITILQRCINRPKPTNLEQKQLEIKELQISLHLRGCFLKNDSAKDCILQCIIHNVAEVN